ncbi:basement membrane-specific heparan sulfate proteoglycan core protein-like [Aplysia californica]|uniref:Basement membrane-specific heparan sulfate proteoglycan core protein-like n=1 Tax=Aplysia californica TaxID=6500 RepID=A0ABM1W2B5_APLCA|nr:basement membrane-specific heparan sulfate proteoglycan core protein-like [Aplysia californica]
MSTCDINIIVLEVIKLVPAGNSSAQSLIAPLRANFNATITCDCYEPGSNPVEFSWWKDGSELNTTSQTLALTPVSVHDQGLYICRVTTDDGRGNICDVLARVMGFSQTGDPQTGILTITNTSSSSSDSTFTFNTSMTLLCSCLGSDPQPPPPFLFKWFKDGTELQRQTGPFLQLMASPARSGNYSCEVVAQGGSGFYCSASAAVEFIDTGRNVKLCACNCNTKKLPSTEEEIAETTSQLRRHLSVDVTMLSSSVRQKTSAPDDRVSARTVGSSAAAILVLVFSIIILFDMCRFVMWLYHWIYPFTNS